MICNLCHHEDFFTLSRKIVNDPPYTFFMKKEKFPLEITILLCKRCGWIFRVPFYDDEELKTLYSPTAESLGTLTNECEHARRGMQIYSYIHGVLPRKTLKILDVGGDAGQLMGEFVRNGHQVTVLDLTHTQPGDRRIKKISDDFLSHHGFRYDVIIMSHVLEHVSDVVRFLTHVHNLLDPQGLLYIEVPFELPGIIIKKSLGDHRHVGFFSPLTLKLFLETAGFHVVACELTSEIIGIRIPIIRALASRCHTQVMNRSVSPYPFMLCRVLIQAFSPIPLWLRGKIAISRFILNLRSLKG